MQDGENVALPQPWKNSFSLFGKLAIQGWVGNGGRICIQNALLCVVIIHKAIDAKLFCRYVSALLGDGKEPNIANAIQKGWPASVHIIGKVCCDYFLFVCDQCLYCPTLFCQIVPRSWNPISLNQQSASKQCRTVHNHVIITYQGKHVKQVKIIS